MSNGKRALGRGLADLIPVGGPDTEPPRLEDIHEVSVSSIRANPRQPRTLFDEAALEDLAGSIGRNGLLQPLLVRPRTDGRYEIVAGERRFRAALRAGLARVPVVVRDVTDDETLALALVENLLREDINAMESARAFRRLLDEYGWTQEELSQRVGKSRTAVANLLRLLRLPEEIQQSLEISEISEGHARALLTGDTTPERQRDVWKQIVAKGLSVRDAERLMRAPAAAEATQRSARRAADPTLSSLEEQFRQALGTRVRISGETRRGRIEIEYYSEEELDGLVTRIARNPGPEW